jgi:hypothetical protein
MKGHKKRIESVDGDPRGGFRDFGEFCRAVVNESKNHGNPIDPRLQRLANGSDGGFASTQAAYNEGPISVKAENDHYLLFRFQKILTGIPVSKELRSDRAAFRAYLESKLKEAVTNLIAKQMRKVFKSAELELSRYARVGVTRKRLVTLAKKSPAKKK